MVLTAPRPSVLHPPEGPRQVVPSNVTDLAIQYLKGLGYHVSHGTPDVNLGDFLRCVKDVKPDSWYHLTKSNGSAGRFADNGDRKYTPIQARSRIEDTYGTGTEAQVEKAALSENSGMTGGYIIPLEMSLRILDTVAERSFIYPRATVVPMTRPEMDMPKVDAETATGTAGVPSFFGSIQYKWGREKAPAETEPKFRQLALYANDLIGYSNVSNDWLSDTGPAGEDAIVVIFGKGAAWFAEYAFLQGTGSNGQMPLGLVNSPCAIKTGNNGGKTARQTAGTITIGDITVMTSSLLPFSWQNAVWACGPDALTPIQQLAQYFINIELGNWTHRQVPKPVGMLSTLPLFVTEKLPALGTPGDLILFDPSLYVIGVRQEVVVDVSDQSLFQTNQTVFRVWLRIDGKPLLSSKVTLQDTVRTVSPVVVLN